MPCQLEARLGGSDGDHQSRPPERGESPGRQTHRTRSLHHHGVTHGEVTALDRRKPGEQSTAAPNDIVCIEPVGKFDDAHAGLEVDLLGPAAEWAVVGGIRDPVHPPAGTAIRLPRHRAEIAAVTDFVDVIERHDISGTELGTEGVAIRTSGFEHPAHAHMTGYDGIRDACQPSVVEVHVGAAHLAGDGFQQHPAILENRLIDVPDFQWGVWLRHNGGPDRHLSQQLQSRGASANYQSVGLTGSGQGDGRTEHPIAWAGRTVGRVAPKSGAADRRGVPPGKVGRKWWKCARLPRCQMTPEQRT